MDKHDICYEFILIYLFIYLFVLFFYLFLSIVKNPKTIYWFKLDFQYDLRHLKLSEVKVFPVNNICDQLTTTAIDGQSLSLVILYMIQRNVSSVFKI